MFKIGDKVLILNAEGGCPLEAVGTVQVVVAVGRYAHIQFNGTLYLYQNNQLSHVKPLRGPNGRFIANPLNVKKKAAVAPVKAAPKPFDMHNALQEGNKDDAVSFYGMQYKKSKPRVYAGDVCNARMTWGYDVPDDDEMTEMMICIKRHVMVMSAKQVVEYIPYVNWILQFSPWAPCFLTKTYEEAVEKGVLMNLDENVSHLMGAAIALRQGSEFSKLTPLFNELMADGVDGWTAFLVSNYVYKIGWELRVTGLTPHHVLSSEMPIHLIRKFGNDGYAKKEGIRKGGRAQRAYYVFGAIVGTYQQNGWGLRFPAGQAFESWMKDHLPTKKVGEGFVTKTIITMDDVKSLTTSLTEYLKGE